MEIWQKKSLPYMIAFLFKIVLYFIVWYLILSKNTHLLPFLGWQVLAVDTDRNCITFVLLKEDHTV